MNIPPVLYGWLSLPGRERRGGGPCSRGLHAIGRAVRWLYLLGAELFPRYERPLTINDLQDKLSSPKSAMMRMLAPSASTYAAEAAF